MRRKLDAFALECATRRSKCTGSLPILAVLLVGLLLMANHIVATELTLAGVATADCLIMQFQLCHFDDVLAVDARSSVVHAVLVGVQSNNLLGTLSIGTSHKCILALLANMMLHQ